jgi:ubiquinone/menaquinone biosynthesis C-methylase UbiE
MKAVISGKGQLSREALSLYHAAAQSYELAKDGELPYGLAREHFEKVDTLCRRIQKACPNVVDNLHLWSRAAFELGHYQESVSLIEQALEKTNEEPTLWYSYGYAHLALRELETARTAFITALKLDPNATRADLGLAHCLFLQEDWVTAFQHYRALITKYPQDRFVKQQIILVLSKLKADEYNVELESDLIGYLAFNELDVAPLSFFCASLFKHKYLQAPIAAKTDQAQTLIADPLLNAMLEHIIICDPSIEQLLIECRSHLLLKLLTKQQPLTEGEIHFCLHLAIHQQRTEHCLFIPSHENPLLLEVKHLIESAWALTQPAQPLALIQHFALLYSNYLPLSSVTSQSQQQHHLHLAFSVDNPLWAWPCDWVNWMHDLIVEPQSLHKLTPNIKQCSPIHTASQKVQRQYEQNPYPKWSYLPARTPNDYNRALQQQLMASPALSQALEKRLTKPKLKILIAGCGTGRHALHLAQNFEQLDITAIDLSRSSLSYAQYKARQLNASQVAFYQGDILTLPSDWQFDIIECSGVLHHMNNPLLGLKRLLELLEPGGLIKLGLYSQIARQNLLKLREGLKKHCLSDLSAAHLRNLRASLLQHSDSQLLNETLASPDFYNLSGFRDLMLHVTEQDYTPTAIASLIKHTDLTFLGFSSLTESTKQSYRKQFPDDPGGLSLAHWEIYERERPQTFGHMYQFFCCLPV